MSDVNGIDAQMRAMQEWSQRFADVAFPGWRERMERAGYQGRRCGWYPAKPPRRRTLALGLRAWDKGER